MISSTATGSIDRGWSSSGIHIDATLAPPNLPRAVVRTPALESSAIAERTVGRDTSKRCARTRSPGS